MQIAHILPREYLVMGEDLNTAEYLGADYLEDDEAHSHFQQAVAAGKHLMVHASSKLALLSIEVAAQLRANEIIVPYAVGDREETLKLMKEFLEVFEKHYSGNNTPPHRPNLMVVPQGTGVLDYEECFMEMYHLQDKVKTFGLSASTLAKVGSEYTGTDAAYPSRTHYFKRRLRKYFRMNPTWEVCLLDLQNSGAQELAECVGQFENITRCVSSQGFAMALAGRKLSDEGTTYEDVDLKDAPKLKEEEVLALADANIRFLNAHGRSIGATVAT